MRDSIMRRAVKTLMICASIAGASAARAQASSQLPEQVNPQIEQTAREVGRSLRCVVCQNQSIEDSDAPLAADMRALVRRRLAGGDSPDAVIEFMRERYGDYVLLKPPVQGNTFILWFAPFALLGGALIYGVSAARRTATSTPAPLSEAEQAELERIKHNSSQNQSASQKKSISQEGRI